MFKSIKRLSQTPKDMMLTLTMDDVQLTRKNAAAGKQFIQLGFNRGNLNDFTKEFLVNDNRVLIDETFNKKTTVYFKNGQP